MKFEITPESKETIFSAAGADTWHKHLDVHTTGYIAGTLAAIIRQVQNTEWESSESLLEFLATKYHSENGEKSIAHKNTASGIFAIAGVLDLEIKFMEILQRKSSERQQPPTPEAKGENGTRWRDIKLEEKHKNGLSQLGD